MKTRICIFSSIILLGCSSTSGGQIDGGFSNHDGNIAGNSGQAGMAGTTNGGNSGQSGSSGQAGDSSQCIPKNCTTIGLELGGEACGMAYDGCNNYINCDIPEYFGDPEGCSNPFETCGGAPPKPDGTVGQGISNLCGGGCSLQKYNFRCKQFNGSYYEYMCSSPRNEFINYSNESCVPWNNNYPSIFWCCQTG